MGCKSRSRPRSRSHRRATTRCSPTSSGCGTSGARRAGAAARVVRRGRPRRHRPRPTRRLPQARPRPGPDHRGGQVLGRPALEPSAAPPARAARPRVARRAHREALRLARPPRRARAPLRPHQRLRRRVPDGGHDRALARRRRRLACTDTRRRAARLERGGAGRLDVPAGARVREPGRRAAGSRARRRPAQRDGRRRRAGARDRRRRGPVGLQARDRTARARSAEIVRELAAAQASLKASGTPPADDLIPAPEQSAAYRAAFELGRHRRTRARARPRRSG